MVENTTHIRNTTLISLTKPNAHKYCDRVIHSINSTHIFHWTEKNFFYESPKKWDLSFILLHQADVLGGCICSEKQFEMFIHILFVDKLFQGKGFGKILLKNLIYKARENGYRKVWLKVRKENSVAMKLYQGESFDIISTEDDVFVMAKSV